MSSVTHDNFMFEAASSFNPKFKPVSRR